MTFKKPTAKQHVTALRSTTERYMRGMMAHSTFTRHMRYLWTRVEQSPVMKRRVSALLRETLAAESSLVLKGGVR